MVSTDRLPAFVALSFALVLVPGPSVLFVIGRALAQGRRAALITVVGNTPGRVPAGGGGGVRGGRGRG
ncbi:hypothetical protein K7G98_00770, partial [Saccharothrix sp. MB29]|nr:hypothetical protein [Saccharothrix sp. MB29]